MDIQYFGAHCVRINTKEATIVINDNVTSLGAKKPVIKKDNIAVFTNDDVREKADTKDAKTVIDMPGEYEISTVSILGVPAQAHLDESGERATMYRLVINDIRVVVVAHMHPDIDETKLEALGTTDVLIVPVGGNGYTLDPVGAAKVIKKIDPRIIIPTHYAAKGIDYEVPQQSLEEALKVLSMEPAETTDKLKLKPGALMPEAQQLIVLETQLQ